MLNKVIFFLVIIYLCFLFRSNSFAVEGNSRGLGMLLMLMFTFAMLIISLVSTIKLSETNFSLTTKILSGISVFLLPLLAIYIIVKSENLESEPQIFINQCFYYLALTSFYVLVNYIFLSRIPYQVWLLAAAILLFNVFSYLYTLQNNVSDHKTQKVINNYGQAYKISRRIAFAVLDIFFEGSKFTDHKFLLNTRHIKLSTKKLKGMDINILHPN